MLGPSIKQWKEGLGIVDDFGIEIGEDLATAITHIAFASRLKLKDLDEDGPFFTYYEQEYLIHGKANGLRCLVKQITDSTDKMPYKPGNLQLFVEFKQIQGALQQGEVLAARDFALDFGLHAQDVNEFNRLPCGVLPRSTTRSSRRDLARWRCSSHCPWI